MAVTIQPVESKRPGGILGCKSGCKSGCNKLLQKAASDAARAVHLNAHAADEGRLVAGQVQGGVGHIQRG